jgi:alcohol dehydrogenase (NADP+)
VRPPSFLSVKRRDKKLTRLLGNADAKNWTNFEVTKYPSKRWEETDIEIAITHCGVCGSDVHTLSGGWGDIQTPLVVGHEIVGIARRVGSQVQGFKVGDRVGVGAQIWSCLDCKLCKSDNENYCPKQVDTYVRMPSRFSVLCSFWYS